MHVSFFLVLLVALYGFVYGVPRVESSSQCGGELEHSSVIILCGSLVLKVLNKFPMSCLHFEMVCFMWLSNVTSSDIIIPRSFSCDFLLILFPLESWYVIRRWSVLPNIKISQGVSKRN